MADASLDLLEVSIERVLGVREGSAQAVVLEREGKRFLIFVGPAEGAAVRRELAGERAERPLTHDLLDYVLRAFDVAVTKVVISALVNDVFCATISLTQRIGDDVNEVRLDARASDSIVVALKAKAPLYVTRRVFDVVDDVSEQLEKLEAAEGGATSPFQSFETVGEEESEPGGTSGLEGEAEDLEANDGDDESPDDDEDETEDRDRPLRGD
jgi:uncharacterized protein